MLGLKELFLLDPNITFLNHGSFGATPRPVFEAYQKWQYELERQPVEFLGRRASNLLASARCDLAGYLHTEAQNLVYITNTTIAINIVARSLKLGPGDEVLASDHEYGAMDRTWHFLSQKSGFRYKNQAIQTPITSSQSIIDQFWRAVTPATRVIFLSHITSPTALIFPIQEICKKARQQNILTIIDGAHAPGQLDLDLEKLDADFYAGNLHKWLCAPKGAAFLYAHPRRQHLIEPLIVSWGWQSEFPSSSKFIDYLEWQGTRDIAPFLAVPEAIRFQEEYDWSHVREACSNMALELRSKIEIITGSPSICPGESAWFRQMVSCTLPDHINTAELKNTLYDQFHIEVPVLLWNNMPLLRVSIQGYNSENDINALLHALRQILSGS